MELAIPMSILTQVRGKLKKLDRLLTVPKFYGPLATVVFTVLYHLGAMYLGYSISLTWITCFVVLGTFLSGLRGGAVAALWAMAYALYAVDFNRAIQAVFGLSLIVFIVGWQTQKLRQIYQASDELLNGNATKLKEGLKFLREAKTELAKTRDKIELGEDRLGNVLSTVVGYKALREMIKEVDDWHKDIENMQHLQDMEKGKTQPLEE